MSGVIDDWYQVFRLADSDAKQNVKTLKAHEEELAVALKQSVPGLAKESGEAAAQAAFSSIGTEDRLSAQGHHALLLAPDAFHVGVLFQPTLAFLDRMVEILPAGVESARPASVFLEEFVLTVYLPQLQEKVHNLFHVAISGTHSFHESWSRFHCAAGPEAFREDVTLRAVYKQPLVKVRSTMIALRRLSIFSGDRSNHCTGEHPNGNASDHAVPQGGLFATCTRRHHTVLPTMQRSIARLSGSGDHASRPAISYQGCAVDTESGRREMSHCYAEDYCMSLHLSRMTLT